MPLVLFMSIAFVGAIFLKIVDEPFLKGVWTFMVVIFLLLGFAMFVMKGGIKVLQREINDAGGRISFN